MLPNRFPDQGEKPEYNTVDATLWYFHAVDRYLQSSNDAALLRDLYPVLTDIIDWHRRGTRYSIHVDPNDGLLAAGEPGVQLTWMDAKVGDWVVTARIGKPVEINALWYNALAVMTRLATRISDKRAAAQYRNQAKAVAAQFRERFWNAEQGGLYDVIDGPEGEPDDAGRRRDRSLRPNQLFAVSLPASPLDPAQARVVVDLCARELYTPLGMRSLGAGDSRYVRRYAGGPYERDGSYHQGTVWSWLLGPFVTAHYRVYRDAPLARSYLEGMAGHLCDAGLGQISEIFDADAPHAPRGCTAQAWSVAEVLRAWLELSTPSTSDNDGDTTR
jgi:predicted glycogen debranching enzyme